MSKITSYTGTIAFSDGVTPVRTLNAGQETAPHVPREQHLTAQLDTQLSSQLARIRQNIGSEKNSPNPESEDGRGRLVDLKA